MNTTALQLALTLNQAARQSTNITSCLMSVASVHDCSDAVSQGNCRSDRKSKEQGRVCIVCERTKENSPDNANIVAVRRTYEGSVQLKKPSVTDAKEKDTSRESVKPNKKQLQQFNPTAEQFRMLPSWLALLLALHLLVLPFVLVMQT